MEAEVLFLLLCFMVGSQAFRTTNQGDTADSRHDTMNNQAEENEGERMLAANSYPAQTDFMRQLIRYLERVGR